MNENTEPAQPAVEKLVMDPGPKIPSDVQVHSSVWQPTGNQENLKSPIEKLPSVEMVITGNEGDVLGTFSFGVNPQLASWLSRADQIDDPKKPVRRNKEALLVLGQSIFVVEREYALMLRVMAYPTRTQLEIMELAKTMPETAIYTLVVSY